MKDIDRTAASDFLFNSLMQWSHGLFHTPPAAMGTPRAH